MEELEAMSHTTRVAAAVSKPPAVVAAQDGEAPAPHSADLYPSQAPIFNPDLAGCSPPPPGDAANASALVYSTIIPFSLSGVEVRGSFNLLL